MNTNALAVQQDSVVANLQRASTALAEAKTIQQTKKIIDVAAAAEIYAKRQQLGEENIAIAHSIKLEALRKLGEMLKAAPKAKGASGPGRGKAGSKSGPAFNDAPTLAELGLDKKTSSIAQKLADLPDEAFEQVREGHETIAKALAAVKEAKATPATEAAPVLEVVSELPKKEATEESTQPAEPEYTETDHHIDQLQGAVSTLREENDRLANIAAAKAFEGSEEERSDLLNRLNSLTEENARLRIELDAVKASRDTYMRENAQIKKQLKMQRKQLGMAA